MSPLSLSSPDRSRNGGALGILLFVLALLALGGAGWWYVTHRKANAATYQTIAASRGDLVQAVTATGTLNPVLNVQVGSQISGIIQKLFADYNSPVKANQIVAQIDPATYQAAVMQAEGDLASAKAALELAQISERRSEELRKTNATPQATLDQAIATLHQAEATVKIKDGSLSQAKVNFERCTITSPIDGIVISRSVDVGQTVAASLSAPVIFTIANDLTKMQIDANVAEADVGNVESGQDVDFIVDAFPFRTFHGKVIQVRNAATTVQNVVTYDAVIEVKNEDMKLKPGMTANASFIIAHRENVLKVGNAALRFRMPELNATEPNGTASPMPNKAGGGENHGNHKGGGGKPRVQRTVYVLREGAAEPQAVQIKVGISDGIFTEVQEGLQEGDRVVVASSGGPLQSSMPGMANPFGGGPRRF